MIRHLRELTVKRLEHIFDPAGLPLVAKSSPDLYTTSILVRGGPGTGKTTLALALGQAIAADGGGALVYLTTEFSPTEIRFKADLLHFDERGVPLWAWNGSRSEAPQATAGAVFIHHISPPATSEDPDVQAFEASSAGKKQVILEAAWQLLDIGDGQTRPSIAGIPVRAVVIDAFILPDYGGDDAEVRTDLVAFIQALETLGVTPILVEEVAPDSPSWFPFIVDLVFLLARQKSAEREWERTLTCPKSRYGLVSAGPHTYSLSDKGTPALPVDFDLQRHLSRLLPEVDHINITGIRSRPGASRDALRRPIEELYTPLRSHRPRERDEQNPTPDSERIELPELLRAHHRLLLEGQPGSGKTTFLNLVTCMLARDLSPGIEPPADAASWSEKHLGLAGPAPIPGLVRIAQLVPLLTKHAADGRGDDRRWLLHLLALRTCPEEQLALDLGDPGHQHRCKQWDALLTNGQAVLLLDGLDEVADEALRERVFKIFRDACTTWTASQILVTSRPIQTEALQRMGFHKATIDAFQPEEVERFVHQWSSALHEEKAPESSAHKARILLKAIATRDELRDLAANPVMLTCLCVVHWNEGGLPEGRARVYHAVFGWMLRSREEARVAAGYSTEFAEYAFPSLALAMMVGPEGKRARIDFWQAASALDADVAREFPSEAHWRRWARTWLLRECEWSHIIEEVDGDELKFWHLTMQEFAAALALAQRRDGDDDPQRDWWPIVREHLDHVQWRETIALLPGCLYDEGGRTRVDKLVERVLIEADTGTLLDTARSVGVLGRILPTMRAYKYRIDPALAERLKTLQARATGLFTPEGAAQVPVQVRIAAAEALGAAGFPRPAGEYLELPGQGVSLGKFPVTVAEYAEFVAAGGYTDAGNWDAEGLRFRDKYRWTAPGSWDSQQEHPTRPVVEVSWCEARAYCRWLERRLGRPVRLPLVAEWEFAASPDGREYPWGAAKPDDDLANFKEDVGSPTPVGVYPRGAGKFGHQDLAGNVCDWCEDGEPEPDTKRREMEGDQRWLKGGSYWNDEGALAAAYRLKNWSRSRYKHYGFRVVVSASRFDL